MVFRDVVSITGTKFILKFQIKIESIGSKIQRVNENQLDKCTSKEEEG